MRKKLLLLCLGMFSAVTSAQNLITENFDALGNPITLPTGWTVTNQSNPIGTIDWFRGGEGTTFAGYNGGQNGYIGANFNSTAEVGVISNWLMSPVLNLQNGDVVSFYTRTATGSIYADNLELRISTAGAASVNPSGSTGLGSYTTLAVTVNTSFPSAAGYPQTWTRYSYTVAGLAGATNCRIAFRYTVPTSAGPDGTNSNYIGIDAFAVDRTMSTSDFFAKNFSIYPNPASNVLNISTKGDAQIQTIQILDLNGRIVKTSTLNGVSEAQMNVAELTSGVYFVDIISSEGKATSKFVKN